jgi:hypothetical protein
MGAEGVNGLDFQPARRLQRLGEQLARPRQVQVIRRRSAQMCQFLGQRPVGHDRPVAQPLEQATLHLCGGRPGVGDAQDTLRLDVQQQQPRHPVDQRLGLARPGIGRDEDIDVRIRRLILQARRHGAIGGAHSSPPSLSAELHSKTRARCA